MAEAEPTSPLPSPRVLILSNTLGRGGAEQSIVNLVPALLRRGVYVEVASLEPPYDLGAAVEALGVKVHRLRLTRRWNLIEGVAKVVAVAKHGSFDIVQTYDFYSSSYAALAHRWLRPAVIIASFQGLEFDRDDPTTTWRKLRRRFRTHVLRTGIDSGVAVSDAAALHYSRHLGRKDLDVIQNPFPPRIFEWGARADRKAVNRRFGLRDDEFLVLMVGRFIPVKGHDVMIEALRRLRDRGCRPKVLCFGEGPLQGEIAESIRAAALQDQIFLHAPLPHDELFPILGAADLFIQPSLSEGFSLAIGEAMALQRAVISTSVGGTVELVEDGVSGVLVPPADPSTLSDAIYALMADDRRREQLGEMARRRVEMYFSPDVIADKWVAHYQRVLAQRGRH